MIGAYCDSYTDPTWPTWCVPLSEQYIKDGVHAAVTQTFDGSDSWQVALGTSGADRDQHLTGYVSVNVSAGYAFPELKHPTV